MTQVHTISSCLKSDPTLSKISVAEPENKAKPATLGHILVVEDSPVVKAALSHMLKLLGYTVLAVDSGKKVLAQKLESFDLVLLDIELPDMSGIEVSLALRQNYKTIPIIAHTSCPLEPIELACLAAGINAVYSKLTSMTKLDAVLAAWLDRKQ
jgi:CheY-like chemotaxis protein